MSVAPVSVVRVGVGRLTRASLDPMEVPDPMEVVHDAATGLSGSAGPRAALARPRRLYPPERQCTATSKQSRQRCRRCAIPGGSICASHGGNAPAVRAKAAMRLAVLIDPAIDALAWTLQPKQRRDRPALALRAAIDVLGRSGIRAPAEPRGADVRVNVQQNIQHTSNTSIQVGKLTDDEIEEFKRLLEKMGAGHALKTIDAETVPQP
jgi:hypothetical protein